MVENLIEVKIKEKIKGSIVKSLLAREFDQILAESDGAFTAIELAAVFSRLLAEELCIDSAKKDEEMADRAEPSTAPSPEDFNKIYDKILHDVRLHFIGNSLQMLKALGGAVAMRDTGNSDHNYRVTVYSIRLAEALGLNDDKIRTLLKGSFLHDIGKISIPDMTLLKTGKLTENESIDMRSHVTLGAYMIKDVKWLEDATDIVLYHHERWDGSGYNSQLTHDKIPLLARVFAIADVYDALTSKRPYKELIAPDDAGPILEKDRGKHFDPDLLDAFLGISDDVYNELSGKDRKNLDELITSIMDQYFGVDPHHEVIRPRPTRP